MKVCQAPHRRYAYYLTPQGFAEKGRLVARYLECSLDLNRPARDQYAENFQRIGICNCAARGVLVGGGELAEIAVLAGAGEDVVLRAGIDPGANGGRRFGVSIPPRLDAVGQINGAIVTVSGSPHETYENLPAELPISHLRT